MFMWVCRVSNSPRSIPKGLAQRALSLKHSEGKAEIGNVEGGQRQFDVILRNDCVSRQSLVLKRQVERPPQDSQERQDPHPGCKLLGPIAWASSYQLSHTHLK